MKPTDDLEARLREGPMKCHMWGIRCGINNGDQSLDHDEECPAVFAPRLAAFIRERELGMRRDLAADARDRNVLWNALGRPEGTYTTSLAERAAKALAEKDAEIVRLLAKLTVADSKELLEALK